MTDEKQNIVNEEAAAWPDDTPARQGANVEAADERVETTAESEPDRHGAEQTVETNSKSEKSRKKKKASAPPPEEEPLSMRLLRLQADFDNFRKRTVREKKDLYTRANENLIEELLPVLDHMEIAMAAARDHQTPAALLDGFGMVQEQMRTALRKFGLSVIDAESGTFDHNLHEAISHISSPEIPEGGIVTQVRKGYRLGDRLLRPAQVVVSSGASPAEDV